MSKHFHPAPTILAVALCIASVMLIVTCVTAWFHAGEFVTYDGGTPHEALSHEGA